MVNELMKLRSATETEVDFFHFRDRDGHEIDCLLETPDGRVIGIEVKRRRQWMGHDFRHLALARERLGDRFAAGAVFYTGRRPLPFGDRMIAVPINLLWDGVPVPRLS